MEIFVKLILKIRSKMRFDTDGKIAKQKYSISLWVTIQGIHVK